MKFYRMLAILIIGLMIFTGCSKVHVPEYIKDPSIDNLTSSQREELRRIEHSGIQIIKQGMRFTFYIPTDCFFERDTRMLKAHRDKDLMQLAKFIARYIGYFSYPKIFITGHTDTVWLYRERQALSLHYAQSIADSLRENGVPGEIMTVRGAGAKEPIASNHYPKGTVFNRRVEVTLW